MSNRSEVGASSWSRRDVLRAGVAAGACGLGASVSTPAATAGGAEGTSRDDRAVILLLLIGGPSGHETFDPKPDASSEFRGPFRSISTRVPGVRVCEHLPRLASRLDRVRVLRGIGHDDFAIHETGLQLLQTGVISDTGAAESAELERVDLVSKASRVEHFGALAARRARDRGLSGVSARAAAPPFVILPRPLGNTGVGVGQGQVSGNAGDEFAPEFMDLEAGIAPRVARRLGLVPDASRAAYGPSHFGRDCWAARRLVERGARVVVVNAFDTVFGGPSWDAHGARPFATFDDYQRMLLPAFDRAFAALIDDLEGRGRLESTLVVAVGEIGRAARLNALGGRDHSTRAWSAVLAGGGVAGGSVVGATDKTGGEPVDQPVEPRDLYEACRRAVL